MYIHAHTYTHIHTYIHAHLHTYFSNTHYTHTLSPLELQLVLNRLRIPLTLLPELLQYVDTPRATTVRRFSSRFSTRCSSRGDTKPLSL